VSSLGIKRWQQRACDELTVDTVHSWNARAAWFELFHRARGYEGWPLILKRNCWFERVVEEFLDDRAFDVPRTEEGILFSYSYTAYRPFRAAKRRGWKTILGQIDPGPVEERLVAKLQQDSPYADAEWNTAPPEYWNRWCDECDLADRIIVNSQWSKRALVQEGVPSRKIEIVPLAYEQGPPNNGFVREYPCRFTPARPLRVLFLGQANLRKGMGILLDAMRRMNIPEVEFWIVGETSVNVPPNLKNQPNIRWEGSVPRNRAMDYYRAADVFVFPTLSDGFGLTQLEAQKWKLPLIVSRFCGEVARNGENGIVLDEISVDSLEAAITRISKDPAQLAEMSRRSGIDQQFTLSALSKKLISIAEDIDP
jgi:glycosyltransferase involved in cell wall biosynthesis